MKVILLVSALLLALPVMANEASRVQTANLVTLTEQTLNYKVPEDWKFIPVSDAEWTRLTEHFHSPSVTAFSINQAHLTKLRESYELKATTSRLRETLTHEFGHVVCGCSDERRTN